MDSLLTGFDFGTIKSRSGCIVSMSLTFNLQNKLGFDERRWVVKAKRTTAQLPSQQERVPGTIRRSLKIPYAHSLRKQKRWLEIIELRG